MPPKIFAHATENKAHGGGTWGGSGEGRFDLVHGGYDTRPHAPGCWVRSSMWLELL